MWAVPCPSAPRPRCKAITGEQMDAVLQASLKLSTRHYFAVCCMYYAALRREETSKVRFEDFRDGRLHVVGKGLREESVKLHPKLEEALGMLEGRGWCLPGAVPGTHVSPATINTWITVIGAWAGMTDLTPHRLRHTALATANDVTGNLRAVADFARHVKVQTTMIYTRTLERAEDSVLAAL